LLPDKTTQTSILGLANHCLWNWRNILQRLYWTIWDLITAPFYCCCTVHSGQFIFQLAFLLQHVFMRSLGQVFSSLDAHCSESDFFDGFLIFSLW